MDCTYERSRHGLQEKLLASSSVISTPSGGTPPACGRCAFCVRQYADVNGYVAACIHRRWRITAASAALHSVPGLLRPHPTAALPN